MTDVKPNASSGKNFRKTIHPEELQYYYQLMVAQDLLELEIRDKDFYLRLSRGKPGHALPPAAAVSEPVSPEQNQFHSVASPLAGVFYRAPSPQADPFVKEGDKVTQGQVLCIVEAMKVMNEIRADRPCAIRKILVENGKPVTAGQNLFLVDPLT